MEAGSAPQVYQEKKLLEWCRKQTKSYDGVEIKDFYYSLLDGTFLAALIHSINPTAIPSVHTLKKYPREQVIATVLQAASEIGMPVMISKREILAGSKDVFLPDLQHKFVTLLLHWYIHTNSSSSKKTAQPTQSSTVDTQIVHKADIDKNQSSSSSPSSSTSNDATSEWLNKVKQMQLRRMEQKITYEQRAKQRENQRSLEQCRKCAAPLNGELICSCCGTLRRTSSRTLSRSPSSDSAPSSAPSPTSSLQSQNNSAEANSTTPSIKRTASVPSVRPSSPKLSRATNPRPLTSKSSSSSSLPSPSIARSQSTTTIVAAVNTKRPSSSSSEASACRKCGRELNENYSTCQYCGTLRRSNRKLPPPPSATARSSSTTSITAKTPSTSTKPTPQSVQSASSSKSSLITRSSSFTKPQSTTQTSSSSSSSSSTTATVPSSAARALPSAVAAKTPSINRAASSPTLLPLKKSTVAPPSQRAAATVTATAVTVTAVPVTTVTATTVTVTTTAVTVNVTPQQHSQRALPTKSQPTATAATPLQSQPVEVKSEPTEVAPVPVHVPVPAEEPHAATSDTQSPHETIPQFTSHMQTEVTPSVPVPAAVPVPEPSSETQLEDTTQESETSEVPVPVPEAVIESEATSTEPIPSIHETATTSSPTSDTLSTAPTACSTLPSPESLHSSLSTDSIIYVDATTDDSDVNDANDANHTDATDTVTDATHTDDNNAATQTDAPTDAATHTDALSDEHTATEAAENQPPEEDKNADVPTSPQEVPTSIQEVPTSIQEVPSSLHGVQEVPNTSPQEVPTTNLQEVPTSIPTSPIALESPEDFIARILPENSVTTLRMDPSAETQLIEGKDSIEHVNSQDQSRDGESEVGSLKTRNMPTLAAKISAQDITQHSTSQQQIRSNQHEEWLAAEDAVHTAETIETSRDTTSLREETNTTQPAEKKVNEGKKEELNNNDNNENKFRAHRSSASLSPFTLEESGPNYLYYLARALADFKAENQNELGFSKNDILEIYERDASGWWKAGLNGRLGWVPSDYLALLEEGFFDENPPESTDSPSVVHSTLVTPNTSLSRATGRETKLTMQDLEHIFSAIDTEEKERKSMVEGLKEDEDAEPVIEGYLLKQDTTGVVRQWRRRYFMLKGSRLLYFRHKPKPSTPPLGLISLLFTQRIESLPQDAKKPKAIFEVVTPEKVYHLQASTKDSMVDWVCALKEARDTYQQSVKIEKTPITHHGSLVMEQQKSGSLDIWLFGKGFKKRYFVLKAGVLAEFSQANGKVIANVPLYGCQISECKDPEFRKHKHCFEIRGANGRSSLVVRADSEKEMIDWMSALQLQKLSIESTLNTLHS